MRKKADAALLNIYDLAIAVSEGGPHWRVAQAQLNRVADYLTQVMLV